MSYFCPTNRSHESCKQEFPTIKAMEKHVLLAHPEYDYDPDRVAEEPTAEEE